MGGRCYLPGMKTATTVLLALLLCAAMPACGAPRKLDVESSILHTGELPSSGRPLGSMTRALEDELNESWSGINWTTGTVWNQLRRDFARTAAFFR